jgi:hypothetical protein
LASERTFGAQFDEPGSEFFPTPIWWWSAARLEPERLRWQMERLAQGGARNLMVFNLAPAGPGWGTDADDPPFLSERWWELLEGACRDAAELGVSLWLYDQLGFSGANLQGQVVRAQPDAAGMSLERVWVDVDGEGTLVCPSAGVPVAAAVLERSGTVTQLPVDGDRVAWRGRGRLMLFYAVEVGFDFFSAEACSHLLSLFHDRFAERLEPWLGTVVVGTFQDELAPLPTWSRTFAAAFERLHGYDVRPHLAHLWEDTGGDGAAVRRDFQTVRGRLAEEAFFRPLHEWHERHGLLCGFDQNEGARHGEPIGATQLFGDYPGTHRWFSVPGSDHQGDSKFHSSLAHAYGHDRVWIESFHTSGWGGTLEETFDWLVPFVGAGATLYDPQATYYSTERGWWDWAPPATDWRQPYWEHYPVFARAVARLCGVLSCGTHVCDVAVLFPSATVQSGLGLDGPDASATAASETYVRIAGRTTWYAPVSGVLNRLARDFDVLDDDTVAGAAVSEGALAHHGETYRAIVLPACPVLDSAVAARLVELVDAGGTLVAVGALPERAAGRNGDPAPIEALRQRFADGRARFVESPEELGEALADVPRTVEADVPTLCRRSGDETVVFVPAAFPRATRIELPQAYVESWGPWDDDLRIDFDPSRYAATRAVTVAGVRGAPELWEPFSGRRRLLEATEDDGGVTVQVPFTDGPVALLVWGAGGAGEAVPAARDGELVELAGPWEVRVEQTVDDTWHDLALPGEYFPVAAWTLEHAVDGSWLPVHATFGTRARWAGPAPASALPRPGEEPAGGWHPSVWSPSRGIPKDPLHSVVLGVKGHVPEEFLEFGRVAAGEGVHLRAVLHADAPVAGHLVVGAAAAKVAWLDGESVELRGDGYLARAEVSLPAGETLLDLRLVADEARRLRGHVAIVGDLDGYLRPEWLRAPGPVVRDTVVSFASSFHVDGAPAEARLLVGANVPCRVTLDGEELGRQIPVEVEEDKLELYELTGRVSPGAHELRLELLDTGPQVAAALFDGFVRTSAGMVVLRSGADAVAARDGVAVETVLRREQVGYGAPGRRRQIADPAAAHLWRRAHPLPGAAWLEGPQPEGVVLPVELRADAAVVPQRLRLTAPPGAERMRLSLAPGCRLLGVSLDGDAVELGPAHDDGPIDVPTPGSRRPRRVELEIEPAPGLGGGSTLAGPVEFAVGTGELPLGDWQDLGLSSHSGAVRYRRTLGDVPSGPARLDLGDVRGTAEVLVDGESCGARICSPYAFDVHARPGAQLEIRVFNTLAPHLDAVSPTPYVFAGQKRSGLFGPVTLAARGS